MARGTEAAGAGDDSSNMERRRDMAYAAFLFFLSLLSRFLFLFIFALLFIVVLLIIFLFIAMDISDIH